METPNILSKTKAKQLEKEKKATMSNTIINIKEQAYRIFSIKGKSAIYCYPVTQTEAWGITQGKGD